MHGKTTIKIRVKFGTSYHSQDRMLDMEILVERS
jgi:hypothetical protein